MSSLFDLIKRSTGFLGYFKSSGSASAQPLNSKLLQLEVAKKASESLTTLSQSMPAISKTDITAFGNKFGSLVVSDEFLQELSNAIQQPHFGESEETFVKRCKESLYALIDKHFAE